MSIPDRLRALAATARAMADECDAIAVDLTPAPPLPAPAPEPSPSPSQAPAPAAAISVQLTATGTAAPPTAVGQHLEVYLYGSGTTPAAVQQGDQYVATFSGSLADGDRDNSTLFCVRLGGQGTGIRLVILDRTELPDGSYFESYYLGWTMQGDGVLNAFTYRRIKAIIAWVLDNYQQINRNAVLIGGGSMGGWGSVLLGLRNPDLFAAVFPSRPRLRHALPAATVTIPNYPLGPYTAASGTQRQAGVNYPAASAPALSAADGGGSSAVLLDLIAHVSDPANRIPFLAWCCGRNDGYMPFADHVAMVQALRATKRPFCFVWNDGNHSAGDVMLSSIHPSYYAAPNPTQAPLKNSDVVYDTAKGFPYLSGCSLDKDPAVDPAGSINAGFTVLDLVDTPSTYSFRIRNLGYVPGQEAVSAARTVTVTVEPTSSVFSGDRTPKSLTLQPGVWQTVTFQ